MGSGKSTHMIIRHANKYATAIVVPTMALAINLYNSINGTLHAMDSTLTIAALIGQATLSGKPNIVVATIGHLGKLNKYCIFLD